MKKLLAILLTLSMLASFVVLPTFAEEAAGDAVVGETTGGTEEPVGETTDEPIEEAPEASSEPLELEREFHPYNDAIDWFDAAGKTPLKHLTLKGIICFSDRVRNGQNIVWRDLKREHTASH